MDFAGECTGGRKKCQPLPLKPKHLTSPQQGVNLSFWKNGRCDNLTGIPVHNRRVTSYNRD